MERNGKFMGVVGTSFSQDKRFKDFSSTKYVHQLTVIKVGNNELESFKSIKISH